MVAFINDQMPIVADQVPHLAIADETLDQRDVDLLRGTCACRRRSSRCWRCQWRGRSHLLRFLSRQTQAEVDLAGKQTATRAHGLSARETTAVTVGLHGYRALRLDF